MSARRWIAAAILVAGGGGLASSDLTAPLRTDIYEWRLVVGTDTLSFRWPASSLPVKIWVEDSLGMPQHIQRGIDQWRGAFLYGEYDARIVSDSLTADVLVRVLVPPPKPSPTRLGSALAPGCEGATDVDTAATRFQLRLPMRVYVYPKFDPSQVDLTSCFEVTAAHELGHSLGLFRHTADTTDLMYSNPTARRLSGRDIRTAEVVYHFPANLVPVR